MSVKYQKHLIRRYINIILFFMNIPAISILRVRFGWDLRKWKQLIFNINFLYLCFPFILFKFLGSKFKTSVCFPGGGGGQQIVKGNFGLSQLREISETYQDSMVSKHRTSAWLTRFKAGTYLIGNKRYEHFKKVFLKYQLLTLYLVFEINENPPPNKISNKISSLR